MPRVQQLQSHPLKGHSKCTIPSHHRVYQASRELLLLLSMGSGCLAFITIQYDTKEIYIKAEKSDKMNLYNEDELYIQYCLGYGLSQQYSLLMSQQKLSQVPAYSIRINTSAFAYKKSQLRQRTQAEWLGHFWSKCGMDQKKISPSCQDRLSELTTGQIDRIIDMERIRTVLNDKKRKKQEVFFDFNAHPNSHPNVYEANFLAKINAIAIRRNIRHQKSQGFDEYFGEQLQRSPGEKEKKVSQVPYKYLKKYRLDNKNHLPKNMPNEKDDDEKSIQSIEDKLEDFQQRLERSRVQRSKRGREEQAQCSAMRWFSGMSNHYLHKEQPQGATLSNFQRMPSFDIEGELRQTAHRRLSVGRGRSITQPAEPSGRSEPFIKFKINRINRMPRVK